jgi:hypothetical protein
MEWVKAENERALAAIAGPTGKPEDDPMFAKLRAIYDDKEKIPTVRLRGDFVYNFWQDEHHVKGIWRRTTIDDFKTPTPTWETVLDVDDLASKEGKSWVWKGPSFLDYGPGDDQVPRRSVRGEALRRRHGRVHRARVRRRHQEVRGGPRRIRAPAGKEQLLLGESILFSCCMGNMIDVVFVNFRSVATSRGSATISATER